MFRKLILVLLCHVLVVSLTAQEKALVYNVKADAAADVAAAVKKAKAENKHVLLQIGGNWCGWCLKFNKLVTENDTLHTAMDKSYVVVHVNYSQENKNEKLLASLAYPQRFGFPVFVILDGKGNRLHTQNSAYLEEGSGHSSKKVLEFFNHWSPKALDPATYLPKIRS
jgi:thioredoxin-related protein